MADRRLSSRLICPWTPRFCPERKTRPGFGASWLAHTLRDTNLDTRTARARLVARRKPYWRKIDQGCHIGYYKGRRAASWIARRFLGDGKYAETKLGIADDIQDGDGNAVLSFSQAQAKARTWFAELARGKADGEPNGPFAVAHAVRDYLAWYAAHRKALMATTKAAEAHILPALGQVEVSALTTSAIRQWHEGLASSPARVRTGRGKAQKYRKAPAGASGRRQRQATANRILTILKAALNHAWREGKVADDGTWRRVKPFRGVDAARVRYLLPDECTRLVNACDPDFRQLVQAALLSGCRYGELTAMTCGDFNPDSGFVTVRESKSGMPRHIPLNDEGVALFDRTTIGRPSGQPMFVRADGRPWRMSQQRRRLERAAKIAGIEDVSFHILRHTYGSMLAMQGVPMGVIASVLGHADTRMTEKHYAAFAPSYVADTIRASFPALGIVQQDKSERILPHRKVAR